MVIGVAFARRAFIFRPAGTETPLIGAFGADNASQIHAGKSRELLRKLNGLLGLYLAGNDATGLGALLPEDAGQLAGIDTRDSLQIPAPQEFLERHFRPPVAFQQGQITNHKTSCENLLTLKVSTVRAGITDMGVCQCNDLTSVGRVSENLLIARHGGIKNYLTNSLTFSTN